MTNLFVKIYFLKNDLNNINVHLGEDGDPYDPVGRLGGDAVVAVQLTVVAEHLHPGKIY